MKELRCTRNKHGEIESVSLNGNFLPYTRDRFCVHRDNTASLLLNAGCDGVVLEIVDPEDARAGIDFPKLGFSLFVRMGKKGVESVSLRIEIYAPSTFEGNLKATSECENLLHLCRALQSKKLLTGMTHVDRMLLIDPSPQLLPLSNKVKELLDGMDKFADRVKSDCKALRKTIEQRRVAEIVPVADKIVSDFGKP